MAIDERLARKGRSEPIRGLVQQGRYHQAFYASHKSQLNDNGFSDADHQLLSESIAKLDTDTASRADAGGISKGLTRTEAQRLADAKEFVRKVRRVARQALRKNPVEGVTEKSFNAGESLGRSTPKLSQYLTTISGAVRSSDAALAPYFRGEKASEILVARKKDLDEADAAQEVALSALPLETQQIYETKGRLLELIEDMNACGKNAYDGQAPIASQFNKDLLLRARAAAKAAAAPEPALPA